MSAIANRSRITRLPHRRNGRGATLIEALVAILLSAVGLLALAGANVAAVRYSKMSQYRGTATMLAADLAERMRANPAGIAGPAFAYAVADDFAAQASLAAASTACAGYAATCTAAGMAAYDLSTWRNVVRSQLPEGSVRIDTVTATGADVWLAWRDPAVAAPNENATDSRNLALECPPNFSADKSVRCIYFRINL